MLSWFSGDSDWHNSGHTQNKMIRMPQSTWADRYNLIFDVQMGNRALLQVHGGPRRTDSTRGVDEVEGVEFP